MGERRYLLSPQDLAAVDLIPDLVRAGVKSFKIEGRLKSPEYVAAVTRVYRKALDAAMANAAPEISDHDRYSLEMTFSRGLSTGWLAGTNHPYLTHGRFGKKRGPLLGEIADCGEGWIKLTNTSGVPLAAGDGVVFDAGENRDLEQGARIWKMENGRIIFHRTYSGINFDRIRPGHTVYKTSDPKLETELRKFWQNTRPIEKKIPLEIQVRGKPGDALELRCGDVVARSEIKLQTAAKRALDAETLAAQLGRLGDTPFELASLDNQLEGECHLPLSALNHLRRELVTKLDVGRKKTSRPAISSSHVDLMPMISHQEAAMARLSVLCRNFEQLDAAIACGVELVYCDFEDPRRYKHAVAVFREKAHNPKAKILLATPRILKPGEIGYLRLVENAAPDGALLRNLSALNYYKHRNNFIKAGDFSLNVSNPLTARVLMEGADLDFLTVSYDLNIAQVLDLLRSAPPSWFELSLHQHMPMFHMEHCVFCTFLSSGTTYKDCGRPCEKHVVHLRDRVGQLHRLQADVGCRNTLFNGRAQTGARFYNELRSTGLAKFRIELLDEDEATAMKTIRAYQDLIAERIGSIDLLDQVEAIEKLGVTEGTLKM
jgi:putative protease